ncbi:MAG: ABC transporter permease [Thermoplasmataceae archaeon]
MRSRKTDTISMLGYFGSAIISLPIAVLLWYGFAVYHGYAYLTGTVIRSIELTLFSTAMATAIVFLIFTPLAYEISRRQNPVIDSIADIPASIPHPVVGIAILMIGSPITPIGRFLSSIGINFFDTILGMVIALAFVSAPIYIRSMVSVFSSIPRDPEEFAQTLGLSRAIILYRLLLPEHRREIISSALTSMSRGISEFGSLAIVAFYIAGGYFNGTEASSVLVYQYYGYYGAGVAISVSAILIVVSLLIIVMIRLIRGNEETWRD